MRISDWSSDVCSSDLLNLAPDEQRLECGIVDINIVNGQLIDGLLVGIDLVEKRVHVIELALDGEGERRDRAFHALQDIDPQQMNQAFLAVDLPEEALAAPAFGAVFFVVGGMLDIGRASCRERVCQYV